CLVPEKVEREDVERIMNRLVKEGIVRSEKAQLILLLMEKELADLPDEYGDFLRAKFIKTLSLVMGSMVE
ncbi:MAG: hypothetical protein ACM3YE_05500, partial [Bacteroidota bacterium]